MSSNKILELPTELQDLVWSYCSLPDLMNFALTCTECYNSVKHLLWKEITIPWSGLHKKSVLPAHVYRLSSSIEILFMEEYDHMQPRKWADVMSKYRKVLKRCNPRKLKKFSFIGLVADRGLRLTVEMLYNLQELEFKDVKYISVAGWEVLATLSCLKKITIISCRIRDIGVRYLSQSKYIQGINLIACRYLTNHSVYYLKMMHRLKALTICNMKIIRSIALISLSELSNLHSLNLSWTEISNEGLARFSSKLQNLEVLEVRGCLLITDDALADLTKLKKLKHLDVQDTKLTFAALERFCEFTGLKQYYKILTLPVER